MPLVFRYEPNGTLYDDLVLRLGTREWRCDSYYLAIHRTIEPEREDEAKVRIELRRLLEQWREAVAGLTPGGAVFLPYDFSDQSTRFLCCRLRDERVEIVPGWSRMEGWRISPADIKAHLFGMPDFQADGPSISMTRQEILDGIDSSIQALV
jgi:hypothetical protein